MKLNVKGLVFVGFAAAVFASAADAADKIVTSKTYVDAKYIGDGTTITMTSPTEGPNAGKNVFSVSGDLSEYEGDSPVVVNDHHISVNVMNADSQGSSGLVPSGTGDATKVLTGAGTWVDLGDNTPYTGTGLIDVDSSTHEITTTAEVNVQANWDEATTTSDAYILNKPTITNDSGDITGATSADTKELPTTYAVQQYVTSTQYTSPQNSLITVDNVNHTIDTTAEENVQANWNETNTSSDAYIQNKPTIGSATITVQQAGQNDQTFTVNDTTGTTITIANPWTAPEANYCTASTPCALVNDGTNITWERIQQ